MTNEKFIGEVQTLENFFTVYCKGKYHIQCHQFETLEYKGVKYDIELNLCKDCYSLINYSFDRLKECPHDIKPRCRTCPSPCYEKKEWKKLARLMAFSGLKLGLTKIKKFFKINKKEEK
ncbi:MAG: hypothetical protein HOB77_06245 [Campylobacteraceae bacterium]|jgi:hypothetical protein|nr:hypothetical protein [Campylobacteraceae bacterium]